MKTKVMHLMRQRDADKARARVRFLIHTMLFISVFVFLFLSTRSLGPLAVVAMAVAGLGYAVYALMFFKLNASRRADDWNKLYFQDGEAVKATKEDDDEDLDVAAGDDVCTPTGTVPLG